MNINFISAGAGTGKTHRVTEIITECLVNGTCRPSGLVATTFTKKAAHELAERIRNRLFTQCEAGLAQRLEESRIGTVHGVCQGLLARFAFEAGISPRLEVLGESEAATLLGEASESVLSREEIQSIQALGDRLAQLESQDGIPSGLLWKKTVKQLVDLSRANGFQPTELARMAEQSCDELLVHFGSETSDDLNQLLREAIDQALRVIFGNGDGTKGTLGYCEDLQKALQDLDRSLFTWPDWIRLSKATPTKASIDDSEPVRIVAARYVEHPALRRDIRHYTVQLFSVAARTLQTFRELKESRGLLDFTDLEQRALELLDIPEIRTALSKEVDLVVVDEFQDTSPMQLAIFLKFAALAQKCYWVGDIKQAIYGFRGTDPELIVAVVNMLGLKDRLAESRRSVPDLVALSNALFCPAFHTSLGLAESDVALSAHREMPSHGAPAVEFFELTNNELTKKDSRPKELENQPRAAAIAEGVRQLLTATPPRMVAERNRETGQEMLRPLRSRDVAVLCRDNKKAAQIAGQLVSAGFAVSYSRAGLLETPEATLALACLRRMADPEDLLATSEILALQGATEPESWLENRLEYLASRGEQAGADRWGVDPPLAHPTVIALHEAHILIDLVSPSEALDLALDRGKVAATVTGWGPDSRRSEQRRSNLEALRALARAYEETSLTIHNPPTTAGFLFWCEDLVRVNSDDQASDPEADSVRVFTYHSSKGLEWPVVVCTELDYSLKTRLWQPSVVKHPPDSPVDLANPLAGRRLRFWVSPFGKQVKDVALRTRIENSPTALASRCAAQAEELRLLYVGFTRARDLLVPVVEKGRPQPWLEGLQAAWFQAGGPQLTLPDGKRLACNTRTLVPPETFLGEATGSRLRWFPEPGLRKPRLSAFVVASKMPTIAAARVGETIELQRLPTQGRWEDSMLGDALHSLIASEFVAPDFHDRVSRAQRLLEAHGLAANIVAVDALAAVDRLKAAIETRFMPTSVLVEVPFTSVNAMGQQMVGFMDLLLETSDGWVVIDHKSFPGPRSKWNETALSHSGQLAGYAEALVKNGRTLAGVWVHFVVGGGLVKVEL